MRNTLVGKVRKTGGLVRGWRSILLPFGIPVWE